MTETEQAIVFLFGLFAFIVWLVSVYEIKAKHNPYGVFQYGIVIGGFVFADFLIFGLFWTIASLLFLILNDFLLFLLTLSLFWLIRSVGESLYWFLQQFSSLSYKNPPERFFVHRYVKPADAIWFINQIIWQCLSVVFAITTIYLTYRWLQTL